MEFHPKKYLEASILKPGTYALKLGRWEKFIGSEGEDRYMLDFEVAEDPEKTIVEWWNEGNEIAIRRAIQIQGIIDHDNMDKTFPSASEYFEYLLEKLQKYSEDKWLRAVVVVGARKDGTPIARIRQFLGPAPSPKATVGKSDVPF